MATMLLQYSMIAISYDRKGMSNFIHARIAGQPSSPFLPTQWLESQVEEMKF